MTTTIAEHLAAWGVPADYRADYDATPERAALRYREEYGRVLTAIEAVAGAANWYAEETACVAEMVRRRDSAALREWDRDALMSVGWATGPSDEAEDYADRVMDALDDLATIVAEA